MSNSLTIEKPKNYKITEERRVLELSDALFNEAAKPPFTRLFAMTDLGNMIFNALDRARCKPLFRSDLSNAPIRFSTIEVSVPVPVEIEEPNSSNVGLNDDLAAAFEKFKKGQKGKHSNIWGLKDAEDAFHAGIEYEKQRAKLRSEYRDDK